MTKILDSTFARSSLGLTIFSGSVARIRGVGAALDLSAMMRAFLADACGEDGDPRTIRKYTNDELISLTNLISTKLLAEPVFFDICERLMKRIGLDPEHTILNRPRFRCTPVLASEAHLEPTVYGVHRDTWFAEPEAQVNIWISPYDVYENQTFVFYPDYFARSVENSSASFNLDHVRLGINHSHPRPIESPKGTKLSFSAISGDAIVFSAAQLHQTIRNSSCEHRYALQFRMVDVRDIQELSDRLRRDNFSQGSTLGVMHSIAAWRASAEVIHDKGR